MFIPQDFMMERVLTVKANIKRMQNLSWGGASEKAIDLLKSKFTLINFDS